MAIPKEAWGNGAGWTIAAVVGTVIVGIVIALGKAGSMTQPTALGRDPSRWSTIEQPTDPAVVLDGEEGSADAGATYLDIADAYLASYAARRPYDDLLRDDVITPAPADTLPLLDDLVTATGSTPATLFGDAPESLINYDRAPARLDALHAIGQAAIKQGSLLAARARNGEEGEADRARDLLRAAYALGLRLYEERLVHRELEYGYRLMSESLGTLAALAQVQGDAGRAAALRAEREQLVSYVRDTIGPVWEAIGTINDVRTTRDPADLHAGDVAVIATSDEAARLWRTEALLRLGKYRLDATRRGDRAGARRILRDALETLNDPTLRLAAETAASLTQVELQNAR